MCIGLSAYVTQAYLEVAIVYNINNKNNHYCKHINSLGIRKEKWCASIPQVVRVIFYDLTLAQPLAKALCNGDALCLCLWLHG
jgi:hypothetical protein